MAHFSRQESLIRGNRRLNNCLATVGSQQEIKVIRSPLATRNFPLRKEKSKNTNKMRNVEQIRDDLRLTWLASSSKYIFGRETDAYRSQITLSKKWPNLGLLRFTWQLIWYQMLRRLSNSTDRTVRNFYIRLHQQVRLVTKQGSSLF